MKILSNPTITVVDARMGRGKSSAAIRYMNENKGRKRFVYITPFLDEVDRICERCDFDQPGSDECTKLSDLKRLLSAGKNVSTTHALFYMMDNEAMELAKSKCYSLIVDESIEAISQEKCTQGDINLLLTGENPLAVKDEDGRIRWIRNEYSGIFSDFKELASAGRLYNLDSMLFRVLNPDLLRSFDKVFMLTYMFEGQFQRAYLECFGFEYHVVGIKSDEDGFYFSDKPDNPPPIDYSGLIQISDNERWNKLGNDYRALSRGWYRRHKYDSQNAKQLRNSMYNFFRKSGDPSTRMWTSVIEAKDKLIDAKTGRFRDSFLQICSRATNDYRNKTDVAYMANRFIDKDIAKFFAWRNIKIDQDTYALSEMLQWIWRSAIRDEKPIRLYIPSKRMRELFIKWMDAVSKGGPVDLHS